MRRHAKRISQRKMSHVIYDKSRFRSMYTIITITITITFTTIIRSIISTFSKLSFVILTASIASITEFGNRIITILSSRLFLFLVLFYWYFSTIITVFL